MPDQPSLSAAMDKLTLVQGASMAHPLSPGAVQSSTSRYTEPSILGQWEHDRFGVKSSSVAAGNGQQRQQKSTASEWRSYAQSNTSKPLSTSRAPRDVGHANEGAWRKENWKAGVRNEGSGLTGPVLPTLPSHPTLPTTPSLGHDQASHRVYPLTSPLPRSTAQKPSSSQPIPQDQALRKRKSERYIGQIENTICTTEERHPKRASPNWPSPLSAAVGLGENGNEGTFNLAGAPLPHARRPSFERWVSAQTRPHFVSPNGTTIIPLQAKPTSQQDAFLPSPGVQLKAQDEIVSTPTGQPRTSSWDSASTTPRIQNQSPNLPPKPIPSATPSTTALQPTPLSRNRTLPTCEPQFSNIPPISAPTSTPTPKSTPFTPIAAEPSSQTPSPPKSRPKTTDDMARRIIFAGIGAGRVPKRTPEELKKREEDQEKRRLQREERERMGPEEVMKWCGTPTKVEKRPTTQEGGKELM